MHLDSPNPIAHCRTPRGFPWVILLAALVLRSAAAAPAVQFFGAPPGALAEAKTRLAAGEASLRPGLDQLIREADKALRVTPPSVMQKTKPPPSGDLHDYLSTAPYFWPDPNKTNGLPYIRHDGKVNPESRSDASDHGRLGRMSGTVETLALAYYFAGTEAYAEHAARCLRTWFVDPATRMNPHMDFAQGIPGVNVGRGTGLIEGRGLAHAVDAAGLLVGSAAWTSSDREALHAWAGAFLLWMQTSKNGRDEAAARNNHGSFYDAQVMRLALVLDKRDLAAQVARSVGPKRIAVQIEPDGRQPLELERTAGLGYSCFNLEALCELGMLAECVGVDLWQWKSSDGRSIRQGLDFLLPYIDSPAKKWPYQQIKGFDPVVLSPLLRQAARVYHDSKYESVLRRIDSAASHPIQLLSPSRNSGAQ